MLTSRRDIREAENEQCVGGLRNPRFSVKRVLGLKGTGELVKHALDTLLKFHTGLADALVRGDYPLEAFRKVEKDALELVCAALGTQDTSRRSGCLWRAGLVRAFVDTAKDPDIDLFAWLDKGAPTGISMEVKPKGIFPAVSRELAGLELENCYTKAGVHTNYASVSENSKEVDSELRRLLSLGFLRHFDSWNDVTKALGPVVLSKLACIVTTRPDGSTKHRLIVDLLRSHANAFVKLAERVVLPRVKDSVVDLLELRRACSAQEDVEQLVVDFSDAFHTLKVSESEVAYQVVAGPKGDYFAYNTLTFGGGASPLVWGRAAAFLGRSAAALFSPDAFRLQVYVDDPWAAFRGTLEDRTHSMASLLLWWLVLGLPLSWGKVQKGASVRWIGVELESDPRQVSVRIPLDYVNKLSSEIDTLLSLKAIPERRLRKLVGKASWMGSVIWSLKSQVAPIWAALADVARSAGGAGCDSEGATRKAKEILVPTVRVCHALTWLKAFCDNQRGTLMRRYWVNSVKGQFDLQIVCDASPFGLGAFIVRDGVPFEFFAEPISPLDELVLGVVPGESKHQATLEALCVLVALRHWLPVWAGVAYAVVTKSDSMAALGAFVAGKSTKPVINTIVREAALDVAEGTYNIELFRHVPGKLNSISDALSRVFDPARKANIPDDLLGAKQVHPAPRDRGWWKCAGPPSDSSSSSSA